MFEIGQFSGIALAAIAVVLYFVVGYLNIGKTTIGTSSTVLSLLIFACSILLQRMFKNDPMVSSILANGLALTFITVACLDKRRGNGGLLIDRLFGIVGHKPSPRTVMVLNAFVIVTLAMLISAGIQCAVLS